MSRRDELIGGSRASGVRRRLRTPESETAPPMIGWRFLVLAVALAGALSMVGLWNVATVFDARDLEMEASRLQRIAQQRRDQYKALEVRISQLQGGESLRAAAVTGLGMHSPTPMEIERVRVSHEVAARWASAAEGREVPETTPRR